MLGRITPLRTKIALAGAVLFLLVIALVIFDRRGDSPARPPQAVVDPATAAENNFARSMLLTLDDFPADWVEIPGALPPAIPDICSALIPAPIGSASSTTFSPGAGGGGTAEYVLTFATLQDATALMDALTPIANCFVEELLLPAHGTDLLQVTDATVAALQVPIEGARTSAFEITGTAVIPTLSQEPLAVHDDYLFILRGTTVAEVRIRSIPPPDAQTRADLAAKAAAKLK